MVPRVPVLAGPLRAVDVAGNEGQAALPEQSSKGTPLSPRCTQTNSAPPALLPSARDPFVPGRLWVTNPPSAQSSRRSLGGKRQGSDGPPLGRVALPLGSSTCTPSGDTKIACVEVALPVNQTRLSRYRRSEPRDPGRGGGRPRMGPCSAGHRSAPAGDGDRGEGCLGIPVRDPYTRVGVRRATSPAWLASPGWWAREGREPAVRAAG